MSEAPEKPQRLPRSLDFGSLLSWRRLVGITLYLGAAFLALFVLPRAIGIIRFSLDDYYPGIIATRWFAESVALTALIVVVALALIWAGRRIQTRRAFSFSLRMMFATMLVLGFFINRAAWFWQRHEAIHGPNAIGWDSLDGRGSGAPGGLWIFGELGYSEILHSHSLRPDKVQRLKVLFPEALVHRGAEMFKPNGVP